MEREGSPARMLLALFFSWVFPCVCLSQQSGQASPKPLSEPEVIQLLAGEVSSSRIAELAGRMGINFAMTAEVEERLRTAGATDELLEILRKRSVASPEAWQRFEQGRHRLQRGDFGGALVEFDEAEKLAPLWAQVQAERAATLDGMKNYAEAALAWKRYLELAPNASDRKQVEERVQEKIHALVRKGFDAFSARRFGEPEGDNAIFWARQARRVEPDHPAAREMETRAATAWENEARAAVSRQQVDLARQIYQKLSALFPDNSAYPKELTGLETRGQVTLLLARAQNALNAGHYGEPAGENAIELSRQVLQADPGNTAARDLETRAAAAYEDLARGATSRGDMKTAAGVYTRLASLFPGREEFRRQLENLQSLSVRVVHYHGVENRSRFPIIRFAHAGCWGPLRLTPQGVQFASTGGNAGQAHNFSLSASQLSATSGSAKPKTYRKDWADSEIEVTSWVTLEGREGKAEFYMSDESLSSFKAHSAQFWGWNWRPVESRKEKERRK